MSSLSLSLSLSLHPITHTHTHTHTLATQIEEAKRTTDELEERIHKQPMSSKEVMSVRQTIKENYDLIDKFKGMADDFNQQISELQMQHNRY